MRAPTMNEVFVGASLVLLLTATFFLPVYHIFEQPTTTSLQQRSFFSIPDCVQSFQENNVFLPSGLGCSFLIALCATLHLTNLINHLFDRRLCFGPFNSWLRMFLAHPIHAPPFP